MTDGSELYSLIRLLADGEVHSGTQLGHTLGISRAAVWKRVSKLGSLGLKVHRVRTQGYHLGDSIEMLDAGRIRMALGQRHDDGRLIILDSVDSTNQQALVLANSGQCANGTAVLAEHQTLGRGRRGRSWVSPFGSNLYCSIIWRFDEGIGALSGLSLIVGIAVARALKREFDAPVMLKWPNDIVIGDEKLGGILVEIDGDLAGPVTTIIGIGLNVNMREEQGADITQPWTDLGSVKGEQVSRNLLAGAIIDSGRQLISEFAGSSFTAYRSEWNSLNALNGKSVIVETGAEQLVAVAGDVDDDGALLVGTDMKMRRIIGGEVSVRRVE